MSEDLLGFAKAASAESVMAHPLTAATALRALSRAAPAPPVPHPDQGWLPIVLCPTDGVWRLVKLPDGSEIVASFDGRGLGPTSRQWRTKTFGYHNPSRPSGQVYGGVVQMTAPFDTFVIQSLPENVYPTHFRPNDTVHGSPATGGGDGR
jgi:hypothetical protein